MPRAPYINGYNDGIYNRKQNSNTMSKRKCFIDSQGITYYIRGDKMVKSKEHYMFFSLRGSNMTNIYDLIGQDIKAIDIMTQRSVIFTIDEVLVNRNSKHGNVKISNLIYLGICTNPSRYHTKHKKKSFG